MKRMSIGKRIMLISVMAIGIIAAIAGTNYYYFKQLEMKTAGLKQNVIAQLTSSAKMKLAVVQVQQWLTDISATRGLPGFDDGLSEAETWAKNYREESKAFQELVKDKPELLKTQKEMDEAFEGFYEMGKKMAAIYIAKGPKAGNEWMEKFDPFAEKIQELLDTQEKLVHAPIEQEFLSINELVSKATFDSLLMMGVGIFASFFILLFFNRSISGVLVSISRVLEVESGKMLDSSHELSQASERLSIGANQQASSIEETTSSVEEITGMVANNVKHADKSQDLSEEVKQVTIEANETMQKLIKSMDDILVSNDEIENLVKIIGEIGEKTAVIDEIVFQTKLLSFNASVEAERAGEHGRGFAVVAQEVGNLAKMSGDAALEISNIVKQSIDKSEKLTAENRKKVEVGNNLVSDTAKILMEIKKKVQIVSESVAQILEASKEQSLGINQINISMSLLDKSTQENASLADQTSVSSKNIFNQSKELQWVVKELNILLDKAADDYQRGHHTPNNVHKLETKNHEPQKLDNNFKLVSGGESFDSNSNSSNDDWDKL